MKRTMVVIALLGTVSAVVWSTMGAGDEKRSSVKATLTTPNRAFAGSRLTAFHTHLDELMTGDTQGLFRIWSSDRTRVVHEWFAHDGPIRKIFKRKTEIGTVGADGSVARWSRQGQLINRTRLPKYGLNDAAPLNDGSLFVAGERGIVARIASEPVWRMPSIHGRAAFGVDLGPQKKHGVSVGSDGVLRVWSMEFGRELSRWKVDSKLATKVAWRGANVFTAGGDGYVKQWSYSGGIAPQNPVKRWGTGLKTVIAFDVSDEHILTGSEDGAVRLYKRSQELPLFEWSLGPHPQLTVSLNGKVALMGDSQGNVLMRRVTNGELIGTLPAVR